MGFMTYTLPERPPVRGSGGARSRGGVGGCPCLLRPGAAAYVRVSACARMCVCVCMRVCVYVRVYVCVMWWPHPYINDVILSFI